MKEARDIRERTFAFAVRIVKLCQHLDETAGVARTLGWQLLRSGTSIGANVEEAQAGQSRADFISKYAIALKEARETRYWIRLLAASGTLPKARLSDLDSELGEMIRVLAAIIISAKRSRR
jgi:four helix bundle protein